MGVPETLADIAVGNPVALAAVEELIRFNPRLCAGPWAGDAAAARAEIQADGPNVAKPVSYYRTRCPGPQSISELIVTRGIYNGEIQTYLCPLCGTGGDYVPPRPKIIASATVPGSIDPTGSADVTSQLLAFFASVNNGSTITFPANATYRIENTLLLKNRANLIFEGNGATFIATTTGAGVIPDPLIKGPPVPPNIWPQGRRHWMFWNCAGITFRNLTIRGAHPNAGTGPNGYVLAYESQHGVEFQGVNGFEMSGVNIFDVYGDQLTLSNIGANWSANGWVHDNFFARNGRQGIGITGLRDTIIELNDVNDVQRASFDIEPNTGLGGANNVTIRQNRFGPRRLFWFANTGNGNSSIGNILIEDNTSVASLICSCGSPTISVRRGPYTIRRNTSPEVYGSPSGLMVFNNIDGLIVTGNVNPLDPARHMFGVRAVNCTGANVSGNSFAGADWEYQVATQSIGSWGSAGPTIRTYPVPWESR